ncbi:hypothetical protein ACED98_11470 [Streptococcus thoraltensis]
MKLHTATFTLDTEEGTAPYVDIKPHLRQIVKASGIHTGIFALFSPHTTFAIFFGEFAHVYTTQGGE